MTIGEAIDAVMSALDGDVYERCYYVSEAVYHLAGGKKAGLTPMCVGEPKAKWSHWFLRGPHGEIIDLTAGQFNKLPNYAKATGRGFLPVKNGPSAGAKAILAPLKKEE